MPDPKPRSTSSRFDMAEAQREFSEQGYVMLPGLISQSELRRVANQLAQEFDGWNARKDRFQGGGLMSGHLNCYPGRLASGVVKELREAGVFELTQSLLPTDPKAFRLGCNFNLPGSVPQHWHVDGAFLQQFLIVNVAVVDTNLTNGAIAVVPETHKRFYKYWEFAAGRVARRSKRLSAQQGDVLIRPSTLWHRGMPNHSSTARPMLAITLGEQGVSNEDPFAYADGRVEFQMNWFRPNLVGRLRERTTIAVPVAYSAYRFARSLFGNKGYAAF